MSAVRAGCSGCFIDQANLDKAGTARAGGATKAAAAKYGAGHLSALVELSQQLSATGNYPILNHFGVNGSRAQGMSSPIAMMIEDFVGSETCVVKLQEIASRGFTVQAHAGDLPKAQKWGGEGQGNQCVDGDTNSLAAFLIAAGPYSYYHCSYANQHGGSSIWGSASAWPAVPDSWLDWLPEYDYPLGEPTGLATRTPSSANLTGLGSSAHIWHRSFASGTVVSFDSGTGQGRIQWGGAGGKIQVGLPYTNASVARMVAQAGCKWEDV